MFRRSDKTPVSMTGEEGRRSYEQEREKQLGQKVEFCFLFLEFLA